MMKPFATITLLAALGSAQQSCYDACARLEAQYGFNLPVYNCYNQCTGVVNANTRGCVAVGFVTCVAEINALLNAVATAAAFTNCEVLHCQTNEMTGSALLFEFSPSSLYVCLDGIGGMYDCNNPYCDGDDVYSCSF